MPLKRWHIAPTIPSGHLEANSEYDQLLLQILHNREIRTAEQISGFLSPEGGTLADPFELRDMDLAVERILRAVARGESIAVYGDFDVDGITGAALLHEVLDSFGGQVIPYIPHRVEEGYGLNCGALAELAQQGVTLVVAVDCGVGAVEEIRYGTELGLDFIVVDHHQVPDGTIQALAVIDPRRQDCKYPFKDLAAVGVAFRLAQALLKHGRLPGDPRIQEIEEQILDLVALGTVADVVPLVGENRHLVKRGLAALGRTRRLGLKAMLEIAGVKPGSIGTGSIGFVIGPRLNAAGRLSDASASYNLLRTRNPSDAHQLATYLEQTNQERQRMTEEALRNARDKLQLQEGLSKLLMVWSHEYRPGIVGLVAGRLMEEFYRPAVVIELGEEESRGSARSIAELNITQALGQCQDLLIRYGGHARAAGFALKSANLPELASRLRGIVEEELVGIELHPRLNVDCVLPADRVSWDTLRLVETMSPFGFGNPVPTFLTRNLWVVDSRGVGRDLPHLKLKLTDGYRTFNAIGFRLGKYATFFARKRVDVVYQLESNEWNGNLSLQMSVKDLRISDDSP